MEQTTSTIPVIDITALATPSAGHRKTVEHIGDVCRNWGLFYITGHGISVDLISCVWRETKNFFALPNAAKQAVIRTKENARGWYNRELTKNTRDMKEVFDFGYTPNPGLPESDPSNWTRDGYNQWPDLRLSPEFRPTLETYFTECELLVLQLLEAIGEGLGVAPDSLTRDFVGTHTGFLRLNYFPRHDPVNPDQLSSTGNNLGIHHHSDAGALTILLQDEVGGLQVRHHDEWIPVTPVQDSLVINIGDMVQVWSNDRYQAPLHRVLASTQYDRYSLPFFYNPSYDTEYAPLADLINDDSPPKYRTINWGKFRWQRQQGDFANYGQENQIADYRILPRAHQ